jgi:hypothetical protein
VVERRFATMATSPVKESGERLSQTRRCPFQGEAGGRPLEHLQVNTFRSRYVRNPTKHQLGIRSCHLRTLACAKQHRFCQEPDRLDSRPENKLDLHQTISGALQTAAQSGFLIFG